MPVNNQPRQTPRTPSKQGRSGIFFQILGLMLVLAGVFVYLLPQVITLAVRHEQSQPISDSSAASNELGIATFPISVDPATKSIVDNPKADAIFDSNRLLLTSSVGNSFDILNLIASYIDNSHLFQSLASADAAVSGHLITILPGYRKEQVVQVVGSALNWNASQQQEFVAAVEQSNPSLSDGMFAPGNYVIDDSMTPSNVAALMQLQFDRTILSHYSTTTAATVPLPEALTVASLIEREASGPDDMRIISGIIWNRLFNNMNLQIDATLQYAKGENSKGNWWTAVVPKDKYVKSAYNTYMNPGLPPGPIANPSVAAVLAALNPVPTDCLYYFHDSKGQFHCSATYEEHVALLKKYYGQGR